MTFEGSVNRIVLENGLDKHGAAWFEDLTVSNNEKGCTSLTGPITDPAALRGTLNKLRDLRVALDSVRRIEIHPSPPRQTEQYQKPEEARHDN